MDSTDMECAMDVSSDECAYPNMDISSDWFELTTPAEGVVTQTLDSEGRMTGAPTVSSLRTHVTPSPLNEEVMRTEKKDRETLGGMQMRTVTCPMLSVTAEQIEADSRSVYVGNLDYGVKAKHLSEYLSPCGEIKRVTVPRDKFRRCPKGFAYVEFAKESSARTAVEAWTGSLLRGRVIKIAPKRANTPGMGMKSRGSRGRGRRGGF
jgi:hypothetical protein